MSVPEHARLTPQGDEPDPSVVEQLSSKRFRTVRRRVTLRSVADILASPDPESLLQNVLVKGGSAALYGKHATYKSSVALGIAYSVATGLPWAGLEVSPGDVVYIAGEGSGGLKHRIQGLMQHHGVPADNLHFITQALDLLDTGLMREIIDEIKGLPGSPVLIVIDTVARTFGAGDENSTQDMNRYIAAMDWLREVFGCTVLLVHHTPHQGGKLRGSSALPGALDTIIAVERQGNRVVLTCEKQKDAPEFPRICLAASQVEFENGTSSLVLLPDGDNATHRPETAVKDAAPKWAERERTMHEQLATFGAHGASATEWEAAGAQAGVPHASFFRSRAGLLSSGRVEKFDAEGKPRYRVTEATPESEIDDRFVDDDLDDFEW
jgi:hypothetical protein